MRRAIVDFVLTTRAIGSRGCRADTANMFAIARCFKRGPGAKGRNSSRATWNVSLVSSVRSGRITERTVPTSKVTCMGQ